MATINSYPTATPTGSDLIIGTDVSTTPNSTKTFTIDSINELATGTPASGTLNTLALFTSAVAVGDSTIVRSGAGATSIYTFGGGTAINNTSVTTANLTTTGNTILGNAGTDTLTVNAASSFAADATFAAAADIVMSNTSKILLGTTMTIEHPLNGNAIISEVGGGSLSLFSDDTLEIKSGATGENYAKFTKDGPIELYYDNVKKFETTTTGVTVTGTQSSFSGQVTIPTTPVASTDAASKAYVDSVAPGLAGATGYIASWTQASTSAPVPVEIFNNTGATFTWARTSTGLYTVTANSAVFTTNKTFFNLQGQGTSATSQFLEPTSITTTVASYRQLVATSGALQDGNSGWLEIRIYP
tara:strand:+ start:92 stop:1165 length:1074 start_codon:yes stop_codon:yes gene_type:complete